MEWGTVLGAADKAVSKELNVVPAPTELLVTWIKYVQPIQEKIFPFCYLFIIRGNHRKGRVT